MTEKISGGAFKQMVAFGAACITREKQAINDLNVFPVPDGDTGTNMSLTIQTAAAELKKCEPATVGEAAKITASALLRGARGNSGVILSLLFRGLSKSAKGLEVRPGDIFDYAREHADILLLPDQDVLNGLYGGQILGVDDSLWNYDARRFDRYLLLSQGERDMDWVMDHTAILHFCGKRKPWNHSYQGRFSALYKHYQRLVERR